MAAVHPALLATTWGDGSAGAAWPDGSTLGVPSESEGGAVGGSAPEPPALEPAGSIGGSVVAPRVSALGPGAPWSLALEMGSTAGEGDAPMGEPAAKLLDLAGIA